jgi:hypothetical protein
MVIVPRVDPKQLRSAPFQQLCFQGWMGCDDHRWLQDPQVGSMAGHQLCRMVDENPQRTTRSEIEKGLCQRLEASWSMPRGIASQSRSKPRSLTCPVRWTPLAGNETLPMQMMHDGAFGRCAVDTDDDIPWPSCASLSKLVSLSTLTLYEGKEKILDIRRGLSPICVDAGYGTGARWFCSRGKLVLCGSFQNRGGGKKAG